MDFDIQLSSIPLSSLSGRVRLLYCIRDPRIRILDVLELPCCIIVGLLHKGKHHIVPPYRRPYGEVGNCEVVANEVRAKG